MDEEAIKFLHRNCVGKDFMRRDYLRSPGYEICNKDGVYNPAGDYVRHPSGKISELRGQCSHEFIDHVGYPDHGKPNPHWTGCPHSESKMQVLPPPTPERVLGSNLAAPKTVKEVVNDIAPVSENSPGSALEKLDRVIKEAQQQILRDRATRTN